MKSKCLFGLLCILACTSLRAVAQKEELMIITTAESLNRFLGCSSKMYITSSDGKIEEVPLKSLFSSRECISEKVMANDSTVIKRLVEFQRSGWSILTATSYTQPRMDSGGGGPFIMTRYVLIRRE